MINYDTLLDQALRHVIHDALSQTARNGLQSPHHFYIEFLTHYKGVILPEYLKQKYPDSMTIVLEHHFYDLTISRSKFTVTLSFNGLYETLTIPFKAIIKFIDPGVKFGLSFKIKKSEPPPVKPDLDNVIQLDNFRPTHDKTR